MRRTTTALRPGIPVGHSRPSRGWRPKVDSPERCSTRAAAPARTHSSLPRWDWRCWASTWRRRRWPLPAPRPPTRGIEVEFVAADAFHLERLGRTFETVLDSGLFHTFDRDERPRYVASLAAVTEHGGTLYLLSFSDDGPDTGPHPVSREAVAAAFSPGRRMGHHDPRTGPGAHEVPRRRCAGLVRHHHADLKERSALASAPDVRHVHHAVLRPGIRIPSCGGTSSASRMARAAASSSGSRCTQADLVAETEEIDQGVDR